MDFSLETEKERREFLDEYLPNIKFELNSHELETLGSYLLWGKNSKGLNAQQDPDTSIRLKEWATKVSPESLDELLATPGFHEGKLRAINAAPYKRPYTVFDRDHALAMAPPHLYDYFVNLFQQIDEVELIINFYDLKSGKRKKPPRDELLERIQEPRISQLQDYAHKVTPQNYLRLRHYLVELRTEQYTYMDCISTSVQPPINIEEPPHDLILSDLNTDALPFGLNDGSPLSKKIFTWPPNPYDFTEEELGQISNKLWKGANSRIVLDFQNPEHIAAIHKIQFDLIEEGDQDPDQFLSNASFILSTLQFYEDAAKLTPQHRRLLELKHKQWPNAEIRDQLNYEFNTSYSENYISTIYRQKVLPTIAEAAKLHKEIIDNLFFTENFKKCCDCGRVLLRSPSFFMRQSKSMDGYTARCKHCQKIMRDKKRQV